MDTQSSAYKLKAILSNHWSPLERSPLESPKVIEFLVHDLYNPEEILRVLEPLIMDFRKENQDALSLQVETESGNILLHGTIDKGFSGIAIS